MSDERKFDQANIPATSPAPDSGGGMSRHLAESGFWYLLLIICLLGVLARTLWIDQHPRFDEITTLGDYVSQPARTIISSYDAPNNHVLHSLLAHFSIRVFGEGLAALRLPAFLAGVLLVPAVGIMGRQWMGKTTGLWSAALVAGSPLLVLFSTNARGYSIITLLVIILLGMARLWIDKPKFGPGLIWAIIAAIGFWTIPIMALPWGSILLWMSLETAIRPRPVKPLIELALITLASLALTVLLYLPILLTEGLESLTGNRFVRPEVPFTSDNVLAGNLESLYQFLFMDWGWTVVVPLVLAAATGLTVAWRHAPSLFRLSTVLGLTTFLGLIILKDTYQDRFFVYLIPVVFILSGTGAGWGINRLLHNRQPRLEQALPLLLALVGTGAVTMSDRIAYRQESGAFPDAPHLLEWVKNNLSEEDGLVLGFIASKPFAWMAGQEGIHLPERPGSGGDLFVLVQNRSNENLSMNLRLNYLPYEDPLAHATVVEKWKQATLYRMEKGYAERPFNYLWSEARRSEANITVVSPWYGEFMDYFFPWIQHHFHGWQYCLGNSPEAVWIYDRGLNLWFYTTREVYPWIYFEDFDLWLYYSTQTRHPGRWFSRKKDPAEWITEQELREQYAGQASRAPPPPPPGS